MRAFIQTPSCNISHVLPSANVTCVQLLFGVFSPHGRANDTVVTLTRVSGRGAALHSLDLGPMNVTEELKMASLTSLLY